jgi:hypothetical protein
MGFLDQFINSQLSGIGALFGMHRTFKFDTSRNDLFLSFVKKNKLTIILQAPVHANYVSGGIQGATNSIWTHALIMGNEEIIKLLRMRHPELLKHETYPLSLEAAALEFAEATYPKCRIGSLFEYLDESVFQIAFGFNEISTDNVIKILRYAYSRNGMKYDISEILHDVMPNLNIRHNARLHGCSSLVATACNMGMLAVVPYDVPSYAASPGDIYRRLYPSANIQIAKWNYI